MDEIKEILGKVGLSSEGVDRVRLAQGVVGKTTYALAGTLGVLAVAAFGARDNTWAVLGIVGCAILAFCVYFAGVLWFSATHPGLALLEGAELLRWRQMDVSAKGLAGLVPPSLPVIPNPESVPARADDER